MSARNGAAPGVRGADQVIRRVRARGAASVRRCAEMLLAESRARVPLRTGALSRSGRVEADGLKARVSYRAPYAVPQHEETGYRHTHGRSAKYLAGPWRDERRILRKIGEGLWR